MTKYLVIAAENYKGLNVKTFRGDNLKEALQNACDGVNKFYYESDKIRKMTIKVDIDTIKMSSPCFDRKLDTTIDNEYGITNYMSEVYQDGRIAGGFKFLIEKI